MKHQLWCPQRKDVGYKVTTEILYINLGQRGTQSRSWNLWPPVFPLRFLEPAVVSEILHPTWFVKYTTLLMDCSVCVTFLYSTCEKFQGKDIYFSSRWVVCDQAIRSNIPFVRGRYKLLNTFVGTPEAQFHAPSSDASLSWGVLLNNWISPPWFRNSLSIFSVFEEKYDGRRSAFWFRFLATSYSLWLILCDSFLICKNGIIIQVWSGLVWSLCCHSGVPRYRSFAITDMWPWSWQCLSHPGWLAGEEHGSLHRVRLGSGSYHLHAYSMD